jgi:hypothetical protein
VPSTNLIWWGRLAAGLVFIVCLLVPAVAGIASAHTELVEEKKLVLDGVHRLAAQTTPVEETSSAAQGDAEAARDELATQSAAQAEPEPEEMQRNVGGGNAPIWFLVVLGIVIAAILALRLFRR